MIKINYKQIYARKAECEKRIKEACPDATHESGIYRFTRIDEDGFKFTYIGQATRSLLTRLGEHLAGYQHIDLSIRKHGLCSLENPFGYKIEILCHCSPEECDQMEQFYIKQAADEGWQLRNATTGSQGKGKKDLGNSRPSKTYHDGLKQGYTNARREVAHWFDLHLTASVKKPTKNAEKAMERFKRFCDLSSDKDAE